MSFVNWETLVEEFGVETLPCSPVATEEKVDFINELNWFYIQKNRHGFTSERCPV